VRQAGAGRGGGLPSPLPTAQAGGLVGLAAAARGCGSLMALGGTPIAVLGWAMIPDTVEYAQWRFGLRADGAIFSFASFFQKLAKAIGGAGVAGVLALVGYVANTDQTDASLAAIHVMMTLVPGAIMLVMIAAAWYYRLDAGAHAQIVAELEARA